MRIPSFALLILLACAGLATSSPAEAQNSTRKLRDEPSATAAAAGHQVSWREDLAEALKEAKKAKKTVFWYVPTIEGSFMDRKPEVDRYMMAGPFSWPWLIEHLNDHYIPVRTPADRKLCKEYGIERIDFIEPGIIFLSTEKRRKPVVYQRITTFHPSWFQQILYFEEDTQHRWPVVLKAPYAQVFYRDLPTQEDGLAQFDKLLPTLPERNQAGALWLFAAGSRDFQKEGQARTLLQRLMEEHAGHPLAAKAAMELEGHGPYWHGFESYDALPHDATRQNRRGTRILKGILSDTELLLRSQAFLVRMQEMDGAWRDSRYDFGGTDSLPNVHAAVSAIVARGLAGHRPPPDQAESPEFDLSAALQRTYAYLAKDNILNLEDTDEILWAYLYRIRLHAYLLQQEGADRDRLLPLLTRDVEALIGIQGEEGAWYHEYENPFVTASALLGLHEAKELGVAPAGLEKVVERGLIALEASRSKKGAYSYYQGRGRVRTPIEASVGRSPVGEHARLAWDVTRKQDLERAIEASFLHQDPLFRARKYDDHTDVHAYGGFFFWYVMLTRTEAILALPPGKKRARFLEQQRDLILDLPEIDGVFLDSHELGRCYGTGMALWCLDLLEQD